MSPERDEIENLRKALAFYADPFAWKKLHDPENDVSVPDFYSEMSFGDTAVEALGPTALRQEPVSPSPRAPSEPDERQLVQGYILRENGKETFVFSPPLREQLHGYRDFKASREADSPRAPSKQAKAEAIAEVGSLVNEIIRDKQAREADSSAVPAGRPDSIYSAFHLENWTDDDFAKHPAATRKTLAWLLKLEASDVPAAGREAAQLLEAAKMMPRGTPAPGASHTKHDFKIEAGVVWFLDRAIREYEAALARSVAVTEKTK